MGRSDSFLGEKEKLSLDAVLLGGCYNHQAVVAVSSLATHGHFLLCNAGVWESSAHGPFILFFVLF